MAYIWISLAIVSSSFVSQKKIFLCCMEGAILSCLVALITPNILIQVVVFGIGALVLPWIFKPRTRHKPKVARRSKPTNDSVVGQSGIMTQPIFADDLRFGQVSINNELWSALSSNKDAIPEGTPVTVVAIRGVKAVVEPVG